MTKKRNLGKGPELEARVQRLFICQGAFAERGLFLRTAQGGSRLVTDVDIVAHDYSINYHHTRIYAECKGGANVSTLDRVVWVLGVARVIGAESAYLVLDHCDPDSASFAKRNGVDIIQANGLATLETALKIGPSFWPGRTNLRAYRPLERGIESSLRQKEGGGAGEWLREAAELWREASALTFTYGRLNALLGLLERSRSFADTRALGKETSGLYKYLIGCLLVRLAQYLLSSAADTLGMTKTEREDYLAERLMAGSMEIGQTRRVLSLALQLARTKLEAEGSSAPSNWQPDHLLKPPSYARAFAAVVERVIEDGHRARVLPLSMEMRLFGFGGSEKGSAGVLTRARYALELTGVIRGFSTQALGIPEEFTRGPADAIDEVASMEARPAASGVNGGTGGLFRTACGGQAGQPGAEDATKKD